MMTRIPLLAAVLLASCHTLPPPIPPGPDEAQGACEAFCQRRVELSCDDNGTGDSPGQDEVEGTADDVPCAAVCLDVVTEGRYTPSRECAAEAGSCEATEVCIFGSVDGE